MATLLVAAAVIRSGGRVLLTRRLRGAHLEGHWEFPGGKVEAGEDPVQTVVRECWEECAIDVRVCDILDVTFHRYPKRDVLLLFYDCELVRGEVQHMGVADHAWCTAEELDARPMPPPDAAVVCKVKDLLRLPANFSAEGTPTAPRRARFDRPKTRG